MMAGCTCKSVPLPNVQLLSRQHAEAVCGVLDMPAALPACLHDRLHIRLPECHAAAHACSFIWSLWTRDPDVARPEPDKCVTNMRWFAQLHMQEFCEDCEGQARFVRRDPAYADNSLLPDRFFEMVGNSIYTGLRDGFRVSAGATAMQSSGICRHGEGHLDAGCSCGIPAA